MDEEHEQIALIQEDDIEDMVMRENSRPNPGIPNTLPNGKSAVSYKRLAASILCLAFRDLQDSQEGTRRIGAARFICVDNPMLQLWCKWLDCDPEYVIKHAKEIECKTSTPTESPSSSQELLNFIASELGN